jgi:hypothetical protein
MSGGVREGSVDLSCREFGFHTNGMMLSPAGWRFVVVGARRPHGRATPAMRHSSRRLVCTATASGCSQHQANRDGVWVGGITPLRPGGSGRDCED